MVVASHRAAGSVLLAIFAGACVELDTGPGEATRRPPALVRTAHYELQVFGPRPCPAPAAAVRGGTRRLGVELQLRRLGAAQVPASPYYARLVDSDGDVHEATLGSCGPPLAPSLPAEGEAARGVVAFEVPTDARGFTFTYAPRIEGSLTEEVSAPLGR